MLGISHETVLNKMTEELKNAKLALAEGRDWQTSIAHIKLLTELLLEEEPKQSSHPEPRLAEVSKSNVNQINNEDDGTSIFDF